MKKQRNKKQNNWKFFWGILAFFTIVLAILSRQLSAVEVNKESALNPVNNPPPSLLPPMPILPTPSSSLTHALNQIVKINPGPAANTIPQLYQQSFKACNTALALLLSERGLFSHLRPTNGREMTLILDHHNPAFPNSRAMYDPNRHRIILYYQRNLSTVGQCLKSLRNEYFSYQIQVRHENNKIKNTPNICYPFLDALGKVDESRFNHFKSTLMRGKTKVFSLKKVLESSAQKPKAAEQLISKLLAVIEIYEAKTYFRTQEICDINIREQWWQVSAKGQITPGSEYDQKLPKFYGQRLEDGSCTYHYSTPGNSALSHLHGFIGDFYEIVTQFFNNQNSVYANKNEHHLYAELGSTYADFPPDIGELLFPEFYSYMRDFFNHELTTQSNSAKQTI